MAREPGDRIIPKLIPVIRDTVVATKRSLAGHEKEVRRGATQAVIDDMGHEVADLYRPFIDKMLAEAGDRISDELRQHLTDVGSGEHQAQAIGGLLMGPVASGLGTLISNEIAPIVYRIVGANPHLALDPSAAANAVAQGLTDFGFGSAEASYQGFSRDKFNLLFELAQNPPSIADVQQMVSRGTLSANDAHYWMKRNGYPDAVISRLIDLHNQVLSPADAALAVLRGNISHGDGVAAARANGVGAAEFEVLVGNTGEPPGVMDMLAMYRRGIIGRSELEHGILQSRLRNEWIPAIEQYRYQPMTTADAIDATVQNHISEAEARKIADQNGLEPSAFDPLRQTAGSPLSKTEMLRLLRMGKATTEEVKQALRESRLKDKYIDHALELQVQLPPLFTIREMLTAGALTDAEAAKLLAEDGYQDFVIKAIIKSAHKTKTSKTRDLTEGMLSALYREQAIGAADFKDQLKHLGYSETEAAQIQEIDDWAIAKANRDNAITHVRTSFVAHKISESDAQNQLHQLLVPATMVEKLMGDWNLERKSQVRLLTPAQIVAAWKLQILDAAQALGRLVNLGYSGPDAGLLLEIANKGPLTHSARAGG